jgi:sugar lactone lactonase YvrE
MSLRRLGLCLALVLSLSPALAAAQQPTAIITTIVGGGPADGSPAVSAALFWPMRVAMVPGSSDFYVSVVETHRIFRVSAATGAITTVAGAGGPGYNGDGIPANTAQIAYPYGIAVDQATGDLYIADGGNNRIRKVTAATGLISTVAGGGTSNYVDGDGGPATSAWLNTPMGVAFDPTTGDLLIADTYHNRVRRVTAATGIITTVAGTWTPGYNGDGILATAAQLYQPMGVTVVPGTGDVLIADSGNYRVRQVSIATGVITTIAGAGYGGSDADNIPATAAHLYPTEVVIYQPYGHLLIADAGGNRVRLVAADTGNIFTVAGIGGASGFSGDGGPATAAQFYGPYGIALDPATNDLVIADMMNNRVRRMAAATGLITTVAGNGTESYSVENVPAAQAQINNPSGVAVDPATGDVLFADSTGHRVWRVSASTGLMTTFAGTGNYVGLEGDGVPANQAKITGPGALTIDPATGDVIFGEGGSGNLRVRRVSAATGLISTVVGAGSGYGENIPALTAHLYAATGLAIDPRNGDLYIVEGSVNRVRRVSAATGLIATVAGVWGPGYNGDNIPATSAYLNLPSGVAVDPQTGDFFIADAFNYRVRRVSISTGLISTYAGTGTGTGTYNGEDIPATSAQIGEPVNVAVDPATGDLLIVDIYTGRVRRVSATTGRISTVAGSGIVGFNGDNIPATSAMLRYPIAAVGHPLTGAVVISDSGNNRIRQVTSASSLTVGLSGPGSGIVVSAPAGISCPGDCGENFAIGAAVTLTATAAGGSVFAGWTGDPDCSDGSVTVLASRQCTAVFNVPGLQDQTITFDAIGDQPFFDQPFSVTATASSGLPVSFSAFGHCSVNGSAVTATGLGSCTITATQAGNAGFNAAPPVSRAFAIVQASQTISFAPIADKTYGDPPFAISASASSGLPVSFAIAGDCGLTGTTVTLYRAGSCTITATQNGNVSYGAAALVVRTFVIQKKAQTIAFAQPGDQPFGTSFYVSATASSGLSVTFGASGTCAVYGSYVVPSAAGGCTITASQNGNENYLAAPPVARTFAITAAAQTITFGALANKTFGDAPVTLSAAATSGLAVVFSASGPCSIVGSTVQIDGGGSCTVTASQPGNANYAAAAPVARTFTIAKATQTITFGALPDKTLGDPPFTLAATASSGLQVAYGAAGACSVNGAVVTLTAGGLCTVTASQAGNANYNAAPDVVRSFTVVNPNFTLTISLAGAGSGSVTSSPAGLNCPTTCAAPFLAGSTVTLTATPAAGSLFMSWGGACSGTSCTVTMDSAKTVTATFAPNKADLIVTMASMSWPAATPGTSFSAGDTVLNQGGVTSATSTTRYYLSLDTVKDASDRLLTGTRAVPALGFGGTSSGNVVVTIPTSTPLGTYYLLACADDTAHVVEGNEANNCLASTNTILVTRPDLLETSLSAPPATVVRGTSFSVTDTVQNQGGIAGGASTTRYFLSANQVKDGNDRLIGSRSVPALEVNQTSTSTAAVTVPSNMTVGAYYLIACADNAGNVTESDETNNCLASDTTVQVTAP